MKKINPPSLSTAFSENGKSAKRRLTNILNTTPRKIGTAVILITAALAVAAGAAIALGRTSGTDIPAQEIDKAVSEALLNECGHYAETEFWAEGHVILGSEDKMDASTGETIETKIYAVTSVGGYSFMNGMFVKYSGSGAIPVVITIRPGKDTEVKYPMDGSYYEKSIREMFPKPAYLSLKLRDYYPDLLKQERTQARAYLESIGRGEADIGEYKDISSAMPDMSAEASNTILAYQKYGELNNYPLYIGNIEQIEDGRRYIYQTLWDGNESGGTLTWRKTDESGNVIDEKYFFVSGDEVVPSFSAEELTNGENVQ